MKLTSHHRIGSFIAITALALGGCGGKGKGAAAVDNRGGAGAAGAPALPTVTLAEDVELLAVAAKSGEHQTSWPQRVTYLGWTADHRIAYRALICDPDELGGRGPSCELRICTARAGKAMDASSDCENAASFELYGDIEFDAGATDTAADEALSKLGSLTAGTPMRLDAATLTVAHMALTATILHQPPIALIEGSPDDESLGVVSAEAAFVADSPDGKCRGVVGLAKYRSEYEGVHGVLPYPFAAVACAK